VKKYGRFGQATDGNIIRRRRDSIFVPDNYGKNTYFFLTAASNILTIAQSNPLLRFRGNTEQLYVVYSNIYANNNKKGTTVSLPSKQWLRERATV
jgi:hypothetical protein